MTPKDCIDWADKIDSRLGPIPGADADRLAVFLRRAARNLELALSWREECGKLHSQISSLKTAAITLRAFAGGDAVVPDNLRRVPYAAMEAIADWLAYRGAR